MSQAESSRQGVLLARDGWALLGVVMVNRSNGQVTSLYDRTASGQRDVPSCMRTVLYRQVEALHLIYLAQIPSPLALWQPASVRASELHTLQYSTDQRVSDRLALALLEPTVPYIVNLIDSRAWPAASWRTCVASLRAEDHSSRR